MPAQSFTCKFVDSESMQAQIHRVLIQELWHVLIKFSTAVKKFTVRLDSIDLVKMRVWAVMGALWRRLYTTSGYVYTNWRQRRTLTVVRTNQILHGIHDTFIWICESAVDHFLILLLPRSIKFILPSILIAAEGCSNHSMIQKQYITCKLFWNMWTVSINHTAVILYIDLL